MHYFQMAISLCQNSNFMLYLQPARDWKGCAVFLASYDLALMPLKMEAFCGPETDFLWTHILCCILWCPRRFEGWYEYHQLASLGPHSSNSNMSIFINCQLLWIP